MDELSPNPTPEAEVRHDAYSALRVPSYSCYLSGNFLALLGMQMQATTIGWEIWQRTHSNWEVGLVGLIQLLPVLFLGIPAGQLADQFPRMRIVKFGVALLAVGSFLLAWLSWKQVRIEWLYLCLLVNGIAKAVQQPAKASMLPLLIPRELFSNAITWNGSAFQLACVLGPALAGFMIALTDLPAAVYLFEGLSSLIFWCLLLTIEPRPQSLSKKGAGWKDLGAGLAFVFEKKLILSSISLDLFAVLFGGAVAMLPVYADEILQVGPVGLGWLRAAPAIGALVMSLMLAHCSPLTKAGQALLWSVAGFGVATIVFGLSRNYWLSMAMLFLTGALDMISVVIRHTLVQLLTPDEMRGRVGAVNGLFIGASNELGGFESGAVATLFNDPRDSSYGPTVSVVSGGIGTIVVVLITAAMVPSLRRYGPLDNPEGTESKR